MKHRLAPAISAAILGAYALLVDARQAAAGTECVLIEDALIAVDGLLDDWHGIDEASLAGAQSDGAVALRCAVDAGTLYLAIHVRDDAVVRTGRAGKAGQDALVLRLGARRLARWTRLEALPGTRGFESVVSVDGGPPRGGVEMVDSLQDDGWAVEVAMPLGKLAGYERGTPALRYALDHTDHDAGRPRAVRGAGAIYFPGARHVLEAFARQVGLSPRDVRLDVLANVAGGPGLERVIAGPSVVGVLDASYRYLTLPVQSPADLLALRVVDLVGKGRSSILTHYREHGSGGSREVLAVWNVLDDGQMSRTFAAEVAKRVGAARLTNAWRLEPRRGKRGRQASGYDLIVEIGEVSGWTEQTYPDVAAADMRPILTPWGEQQSAVFHFEGVESFGGEPLSVR